MGIKDWLDKLTLKLLARLSGHKVTMGASGEAVFELRDEHGNLKDYRRVPNLITTAGKAALATWLAASSQSAAFMKFLAVGTGSTAADAADTALQTECATRATGTPSASTNTYVVTATFAAGVNTGTITESGLLSASSGGTLFCRNVFSGIVKASGDTLAVTWTITLS